jgi:DNA repair exonuclease SbcCD ATPase subunit
MKRALQEERKISDSLRSNSSSSSSSSLAPFLRIALTQLRELRLEQRGVRAAVDLFQDDVNLCFPDVFSSPSFTRLISSICSSPPPEQCDQCDQCERLRISVSNLEEHTQAQAQRIDTMKEIIKSLNQQEQPDFSEKESELRREFDDERKERAIIMTDLAKQIHHLEQEINQNQSDLTAGKQHLDMQQQQIALLQEQCNVINNELKEKEKECNFVLFLCCIIHYFAQFSFISR